LISFWVVVVGCLDVFVSKPVGSSKKELKVAS